METNDTENETIQFLFTSIKQNDLQTGQGIINMIKN